MFEFDDLYSTTDCLLTAMSESVAKSIFSVALELKAPPDSLKYAFLGSDESLSIIIASDLDWDQEDKLISLLRENKGSFRMDFRGY